MRRLLSRVLDGNMSDKQVPKNLIECIFMYKFMEYLATYTMFYHHHPLYSYHELEYVLTIFLESLLSVNMNIMKLYT